MSSTHNLNGAAAPASVANTRGDYPETENLAANVVPSINDMNPSQGAKEGNEVEGKAPLAISEDTNDPQPRRQTNDNQSDAASVTSATSENAGKRTRSHTSRSRGGNSEENGVKTYNEQDSSPSRSNSEDEKSTFIDALASTLARLDEDAYKKAVLKDANSLLENLVLPMSFPWAHRIAPVVRTIPRDIDEMPSIQTLDDPEVELCSLRNRNFDLAYLHSEDVEPYRLDDKRGFRAVARRGDAPGIIELVTCIPSISSPTSSCPNVGSNSLEVKHSVLLREPSYETLISDGSIEITKTGGDDKNEPDDCSFRIFEKAQEVKRRKLVAGMARLKTTMISVRVGSTSSRPVLFTKEIKARCPLLLSASLPQDFRALVRGKPSSRAPAGRSQLTWIKKFSSRTSHRLTLSSYLTNQKVESGMQKRPRDVTVAVRINGNLICSSGKSETGAVSDIGSSGRKRSSGGSSHAYSNKMVKEAIDKACSDTGERIGSRQCSLDTDTFTKNVLGYESHRDRWNRKVTVKSLGLVFVTPRIDCLPSEDGLVHVLCTASGELQPSNVDDIFNRAVQQSGKKLCTICWSASNTFGDEVSICSGCGVLAHVGCCLGADKHFHPNWRCAVCSKIVESSAPQSSSNSPPHERSARRSSRLPSKGKDASSPITEKEKLACALCPHFGGSMSMLKRDGKEVWAHDVCRIWCDQTTPVLKGESQPDFLDRLGLDFLTCALCGKPESENDRESIGLVKCAAAGCSVHFHPMCALYLSKCEEIRADNLERSASLSGGYTAEMPLSFESIQRNGQDQRLNSIVEKDEFLCRQYLLQFVKCSVPGSHSRATTLLPVCFCGIHNPNRDRSLYGLYPGGKHVDKQVVRVPPRNDSPEIPQSMEE